jgi:hypothetical protein
MTVHVYLDTLTCDHMVTYTHESALENMCIHTHTRMHEQQQMAAASKKGTKGRGPPIKPGNMHKGLPGEAGETLFSASLKRKLAEALPWERGGYVPHQFPHFAVAQSCLHGLLKTACFFGVLRLPVFFLGLWLNDFVREC